MSEPVEIIKSRNAGWCWRCHTCDITVTGLPIELDAVEQGQRHLSTAQHRGFASPVQDEAIVGRAIEMYRDTYAEDIALVKKALAEGRFTVISDDGVYTPPKREETAGEY